MVIRIPFFLENIPILDTPVPVKILIRGFVLIEGSWNVTVFVARKVPTLAPLKVASDVVMLLVFPTAIPLELRVTLEQLIIGKTACPAELTLNELFVLAILPAVRRVDVIPEKVPMPDKRVNPVPVMEDMVLPPQEIPENVAVPPLVTENAELVMKDVVNPVVVIPVNVPSPPLSMLKLLEDERKDVPVIDELQVNVDEIVVGIPVREIITDVALTPPSVREDTLSIEAVLIPASAVIIPPAKILPSPPPPRARVLMLYPDVDIPPFAFKSPKDTVSPSDKTREEALMVAFLNVAPFNSIKAVVYSEGFEMVVLSEKLLRFTY